MNDYKSIQDLIVKAALYDRISTTISPDEFIKGDVIKITFSRGRRHSATRIDLFDKHRDLEEVALYCCKRALQDLLFAPYEEIEINKEN